MISSAPHQPVDRQTVDLVIAERPTASRPDDGAPAGLAAFMADLERLPSGHSEGIYEGRRYGVTINASPDGKRLWLFGRERGGRDYVSFNLYRLEGGRIGLRPCEMATNKVVAFVAGYRPSSAQSRPA